MAQSADCDVREMYVTDQPDLVSPPVGDSPWHRHHIERVYVSGNKLLDMLFLLFGYLGSVIEAV
jgi:hypothetical protein